MAPAKNFFVRCRNRFLRAAPTLLVILILGSCDLSRPSSLDVKVPDLVAMEVRQISVSDKGRIEISANMVETFNEDDYSVFYDAVVVEKNPDGAIILEGGANLIQVNGNNDGSASGNVYVKNLEDNTALKADSVEYEADERQLTGQGAIQIDLGDGLSVYGETLKADLSRNTYVLSDTIQGIIEFDEDDENDENDENDEK